MTRPAPEAQRWAKIRFNAEAFDSTIEIPAPKSIALGPSITTRKSTTEGD